MGQADDQTTVLLFPPRNAINKPVHCVQLKKSIVSSHTFKQISIDHTRKANISQYQ